MRSCGWQERPALAFAADAVPCCHVTILGSFDVDPWCSALKLGLCCVPVCF